MTCGRPDVTNDGPNIERTNPEWETDFGPRAGRAKRILLAGLCASIVLGFLGLVLWMSGSSGSAGSGGIASPRATGSSGGGTPIWVYFAPFAVMLVVIAVCGETVALRIQRKMGWKPDTDE